MSRPYSLTILIFFTLIFLIFNISFIFGVNSLQEEKGYWSKINDMSSNRAGHGVVTCNNKLYVIGGYNNNGFLDSVEAYDPLTGVWETMQHMPYARAEFGICAIDDYIYVIGGCNTLLGKSYSIYPGNVLNSVLVYDTNFNNWSFKTAMPTPRVGLDICVNDGKIYAIGGAKLVWNDCCFFFYNATNSNEVYDPKTDQWEKLAPMTHPRHHVGVVSIGDNIFACGGNKGFDIWPPENIVEVYSVSDNKWMESISMPLKVTGFGIIEFFDKIYVFGGLSYPAYHINKVFEYDPFNNNWRNLSSMITARYSVGAAVLNDEIYVIGGGIDGVRSIFSERNIYLPVSEKFIIPKSNVSSKPYLYVLSPENNSKIRFDDVISGTASTLKGSIQYVEVMINNGSWNKTIGTNNWTYDLDSELLSVGNNTIFLRCYNGLYFSDLELINIFIHEEDTFEVENNTPGFSITLVFFAIIFILYLIKRLK